MFTGIIEARGTIKALAAKGNDCRLTIAVGDLDMGDVALGDSIAVDGICLTVVQFSTTDVAMDASAETLDKTTLGDFRVGRAVNLEKALTPTTRLGGHLVSGHVDGVGIIESRQPVGESLRFCVRIPDGLAKYVAVKGSICIDGVSLTVNRVDGALFEVNIIPHTGMITTINEYKAGRRVNIEVDLVARYLERLLLGDKAATANGTGVSLELLAEHGFLKG